MSSTTTPTGDFIESLFHNMAYQSDDAKAAAALESDLHPDFSFTMNGVPHTRADFTKIMLEARVDSTFKLEKTQEVLASPSLKDASLETVGHVQTFLQTPKAEGKDKVRITSLTVCTVKVGADGGRKVVSVTEVTKGVPA